jgi:DNA-directed RNA polymerase alpha subunit
MEIKQEDIMIEFYESGHKYYCGNGKDFIEVYREYDDSVKVKLQAGNTPRKYTSKTDTVQETIFFALQDYYAYIKDNDFLAQMHDRIVKQGEKIKLGDEDAVFISKKTVGKTENTVLTQPVSTIDSISNRARNALLRNGIEFVADIPSSMAKLLKLEGMGKKSAESIIEFLNSPSCDPTTSDMRIIDLPLSNRAKNALTREGYVLQSEVPKKKSKLLKIKGMGSKSADEILEVCK